MKNEIVLQTSKKLLPSHVLFPYFVKFLSILLFAIYMIYHLQIGVREKHSKLRQGKVRENENFKIIATLLASKPKP